MKKMLTLCLNKLMEENFSLGEQTVDRAELKYGNTPSGALFLLHNLPAERKNDIYENGR
jgi:hypothetical protein